MIKREEYLKAREVIRQYMAQVEEHYKEINLAEKDGILKYIGIDKNKSIRDLDEALSVRLRNILWANEIESLSEISKCTKTEFLKFRNSGKTTLDELEKIMCHLGIEFKRP